MGCCQNTLDTFLFLSQTSGYTALTQCGYNERGSNIENWIIFDACRVEVGKSVAHLPIGARKLFIVSFELSFYQFHLSEIKNCIKELFWNDVYIKFHVKIAILN